METARQADVGLLRELLALVPWQTTGPLAVAPTQARSVVELPVRGGRGSAAYCVAHLVDRPETGTDNSFRPKNGGGSACLREVVLVLEPADAAHDLKDRVFVNSGTGFEEVLKVQREICGHGSVTWRTGDGALVVRPCEPNRPATWNNAATVPLEGWSGAKVVCDTNAGPRVLFAHLDARRFPAM